MQTIDKFNFAGKKAFVRVDFNVPLDENFNITDDTRMRAALPTLKKILADGGSIIIGSHLGRPKGVADKFSLKHIIKHLSELLGVEVQFANDCMGEEAAVKAAALQPGDSLLRIAGQQLRMAAGFCDLRFVHAELPRQNGHHPR